MIAFRASATSSAVAVEGSAIGVRATTSGLDSGIKLTYSVNPTGFYFYSHILFLFFKYWELYFKLPYS